MFNWLKKQKKHPHTTELTDLSSNHGVQYDEQLIDEFHQDHQSLFALFEKIKSHCEKQQYKQLHKKMKLFSSLLRSHLITENVKLYVYLGNAFKGDEDNQELILGFRKEMMAIGRQVNQFISRYEQVTWNHALAHDFMLELENIGEILTRRIEQEEQVLYPLYMPENNYRN